MSKLSSKNKIYIVVAAWLVLCAVMFMYVFGRFDNSNQSLVNDYATVHHSFAVLQAEAESYRLSQEDLAKAKTEPLQPNDLFTEDVTLVNELRTLEALKGTYNLDLSINGLGGTIKNAIKAKTKSDLYMVPYGMTATGNFQDVLHFLENLENLKFITNITTISLTGITGDQVTLNLNANFYLRK